MKDLIPLAQKDMTSCLKTIEHVKAMITAMENTGMFTISVDYDAGTVEAYHTDSNRQVFLAIEKGEDQPWIITHHKKLFI